MGQLHTYTVEFLFCVHDLLHFIGKFSYMSCNLATVASHQGPEMASIGPGGRDLGGHDQEGRTAVGAQSSQN